MKQIIFDYLFLIYVNKYYFNPNNVVNNFIKYIQRKIMKNCTTQL